jgi:hypothetical protein
MRRLLAIFFVTVSLAACGKEIGRIALHDEGSGETTVQVTGGKPLALWTSLDAKYTGTLAARYDVELVQDGTVVGKALCNPLDVSTKISSTETNFGSDRSISWQGKMRCAVTPAKSGAATVRAKLAFDKRPAKLTIGDMSLVVKE